MLVTTVSTGSVILWHFLVDFLKLKQYNTYLLKYMLERANLLIPVGCSDTIWLAWEAWTSCECWGGTIECNQTTKKRVRHCINKTKKCYCTGKNVDREMDCTIQ